MISAMPKSDAHTSETPDFTRELRIAEALARNAGALLRSLQNGKLAVSHKSNGEIVTPSDLASHELICSGLAAEFPDDGVCSEENPPAAPSGRARVWIVDPLDSTSNYVQGGDEYSVSIGLAIRGRAVLGAVYNPVRNELISGYCGYGASWNGVPVRTTFAAFPEKASVLVSSKEWKRGLHVLSKHMSVRPMASMAYKLARVAAGRDDAALSFKERKPWGTCAGIALVLAAGGHVTSLDGELPILECHGPRAWRGLIASGAQLHSAMLAFATRLHSEVRSA